MAGTPTPPKSIEHPHELADVRMISLDLNGCNAWLRQIVSTVAKTPDEPTERLLFIRLQGAVAVLQAGGAMTDEEGTHWLSYAGTLRTAQQRVAELTMNFPTLTPRPETDIGSDPQPKGPAPTGGSLPGLRRSGDPQPKGPAPTGRPAGMP